MRLPETDAVFVVGLLEGEFPQTPGDQGLLTHADRDLMMAQGAELPDCFANKVLREGICFYKALTVARKYLWLSWPTAAHAGDTAPASAALAPVLQYLQVPPCAPTAVQLAAAPAAALDMLGTLTQDPGQGAAGAAVRAVLDESPNLAPGYEAVRRAADTAGAEQRVEDTAALEALLGPGCTSARPGSKIPILPVRLLFAVHFKGRAAPEGRAGPQHQRHADPLGTGKRPAPPG